jgi:hypothetical protein
MFAKLQAQNLISSSLTIPSIIINDGMNNEQVDYKIVMQPKESKTPQRKSSQSSKKFDGFSSIDLFNKIKDEETEEEFKFRLMYHKFIMDQMNINGDLAMTLAEMQTKKIKNTIYYDNESEALLKKIKSEYMKKIKQ